MEEREIAYQGRSLRLYIGDKFKNWTIIDKSFKRKNEDSKFNRYTNLIKCRCSCGVEQSISIDCVFSKDTHKSCKACSIRKDGIGYEDVSSEIMAICKWGAKSRNFSFDITGEHIYNLYIKQNKKCALSGIDIIFNKDYKNNGGTASIDRIDSLKGYSIDNIQIVHKDLNRMKNKYSQEYFIDICKLVANKFK